MITLANIRRAVYYLNKRLDLFESKFPEETITIILNKVKSLENLISEDSNPTQAIDKFNEIVSFLESIPNTNTLLSLLGDLPTKYVSAVEPLNFTESQKQIARANIDLDNISRLGCGYGVCSTDADVAVKEVNITGYQLARNGFVVVTFENSVHANATLNINSFGAKPIYFKGFPIMSNIIKGGDTVTFVYDGSKYIVAIDKYFNVTSEEVHIVATSDSGDISEDAVITIKIDNEVVATGTGSLTFDVDFDDVYVVETSHINGYITPASQTFMASQIIRNITLSYIYIPHDTITIDQSVDDPYTRVTGDVNGTVIQSIRNGSHRYLGKYTATGTMTLCQLLDTDGTKFYNGTNATLDGTQGDVFMKHPTFWTKAVDKGNDVWDISFALLGQPDSSWKEWSGDDLIGVYEASVTTAYDGNVTDNTNDTNYYLRSISGVLSSSNISQANHIAKAQNRGTGFHIVKWQHQNIMAFLFYAKYGHTNCQEECGYGTDANTYNTGEKDSLGMTDSTLGNYNDRGVNFWGIENWWGNKHEQVGNVIVSSKVFNITEDDGTVRQVACNVANWSSIYPKKFVIGDYLDVIATSDQSGGTSDTGYCDAINIGGGGTNMIVRRSLNLKRVNCGITTFDCSANASAKNADNTSRLTFKGNIVIEDNVSAYISATAIG